MTQPVEDERLEPLDELVLYLAVKHSEDQEGVAQALALLMFPLWDIMRFDALDASTPLWLRSVLPAVEKAYLQSQRLTAVFNANVRFASLPFDDPLPVVVPDVERPVSVSPGGFDMPDLVEPGNRLENPVPAGDPFDKPNVAKTLTIEANYRTKKAMPGPEKDLMADAQVRSSGAAIREAINGSRNATHNLIQLDRKRILGYARVTDSDPCAFCAILASRGAVYTKDSFLKTDGKWTVNPDGAKDVPAGFSNVAKVHDHCKCVLRPVYSKSQAMDEQAQYYKELWDQVDKEVGMWLKPEEKRAGEVKQFRDLLEAAPYPGPSGYDVYRIKRALRDREEALLDAGLSPAAPQVRFAARMGRLVA